MGKSEVKVLVVGDFWSGKSKFIETFLRHYPYTDRYREEGFEKYVCELKYHVIYLYNICDAKNCCIFDKVDVILLSYSSSNPETFESLQERWIPNLLKIKVEHHLIMDNVSIQQDILTKEQSTSISNDQVEAFENLFGLLWCTAYSSNYKEVLVILKNILDENSTEDKTASEECIPDTLSENQHNPNELSSVELRSKECYTVELIPNKCPKGVDVVESIPSDSSTVDLSPKQYETQEFIPSDCSITSMSPKEYKTKESTLINCSTVPLSPKENASDESLTSDCSTVPLSPKEYATDESIANDCSTVKLSPKKRATEEFISTAEINPDKCFTFESRSGNCSPVEFSADECSPDHSYPDSLDTWSPVKSSPDATFSSDDSSSDEFTLVNPDAYSADESRHNLF